MTFMKAKALNPLLISCQDTFAYISKAKIAANMDIYIKTRICKTQQSLSHMPRCVLFSILMLIYCIFFLKRPNVYTPTYQVCLSVALGSGLPADTKCALLTLILFWFFLVCA